jgi:hypothetical protein
MTVGASRRRLCTRECSPALDHNQQHNWPLAVPLTAGLVPSGIIPNQCGRGGSFLFGPSQLAAAPEPQFCYVSKFSNGGTNREKRRATSIECRGNDPVSTATDAEVSATC